MPRAGFAVVVVLAASAQTVADIQKLSIEQLTNLEITSVSRRPEPLSDAPAAVFVITRDEIRHSGAVTLAEALRLAPNIEVAQQDAQNYAISARGFNSIDTANKLLVLIDGRSVYSPLHGGVFWDQQKVPLDDIERIEVISDPGGTLYGANAFNGAINIITKNAHDAQGGLLDLKAGNVNQNGLAQYGGRFGANGAYRVYGMGFGIGHTDTHGGSDLRSEGAYPFPGAAEQFDNNGSGYGMEVWGVWQALSWWRLSAGANLLRKNIAYKPGVFVSGSNALSAGFDPGYQLSLRSSMNPVEGGRAGFRRPRRGRAAGHPDPRLHRRGCADRLARRTVAGLSLAGSDLGFRRHADTLTPSAPVAEPRQSVYLDMRWRY